MRQGGWDRKRFEGTELRGKTMGIVGLGRIGQQMARIARAFSMSVVAHDPFLPAERAAELQVRLVPLEQLLRTSDVITLHLALTDETNRLIDAQRLALMKPTAVLINTARGELVDEAALAAAVKEKRIAGAAMDVFSVEPLPADSPLRGLEHVILTPHLAASTAEAQERVAVEIATAVRDALLDGDLSQAINVPGTSGDVLRRLGPLLDLARRLGRLAAGLSEGAVRGVEVAYGGRDDSAPRPVQVSAVQGLLGGLGVEPVSMVNALLLAEERAMRVSLRTSAAEAGFETTVAVTVDTPKGSVRVAGALVGDSHGRVIRIDDFDVDVAPEGWMLVVRNRDVPGVIGRVGTALGSAGINIGSYHQARRARPGERALAAITVDEPPTNGVLDELRRVPDIQDVRLVHFGD
jgi:D-3-phosphoglycerate dehydrogenase